MSDRALMPAIWIAPSNGGAIRPYDPDADGHTLDLEPDDDSTPLVILDWIVEVLGFNPLEETGFTGDDFVPAQHPRGQPENKGEFAKTSGGASNTTSATKRSGAQPTTSGTGTTKQAPTLFTPEDMALPVNASQPFNTPEAIQQGTLTAQEQLSDWLDRGKGVAAALGYTMEAKSPSHTDLNRPGGMLFMGKPKSMQRAAEKVQSDYGGDWSKLLDPVRCTFACDNFGEVKRVLDALKSSGMKLARRPKDRFASPTDAGYRDCLLNVVMPNGMIGEVQLHAKAMLQAKDEGHKWYEIERSLDAASKTRNLIVEERQQRAGAGAQMNRIYADAWSAATKGIGDAALPTEQYSYYSYNNTYFRRINRNGTRRSIDEVLHGNRWVAYIGDCLAPVVFGDRCDDPLQSTGDADFKETDHPRGQPKNKGEFAKASINSIASAKQAKKGAAVSTPVVQKPLLMSIPWEVSSAVKKKVDLDFITRAGLGATVADYTKKFPSTVKTALKMYSGEFSDKINYSLRKGEPAEELRGVVAAIDGWFADPASHIPNDVSAFRGTFLPGKQIAAVDKALAAGRPATFYCPSFTSTSLDPERASSFAENYHPKNTTAIHFAVTVKKGSPVAYINACCTHHPDEFELLLPRGVAMTVTGKKEHYGRTYYEVSVG